MLETPAQRIDRAVSLQQQAAEHLAVAIRKIVESDKIIADLKRDHGERFICGGKAWKLEHGATWFGLIGNRDWLRPDDSVTIIK